MKEILTAGVVLLVLIGVGIIRLLEKIRLLLYRDYPINLPDRWKHFSLIDPDGADWTDGESFWRISIQISR